MTSNQSHSTVFCFNKTQWNFSQNSQNSVEKKALIMFSIEWQIYCSGINMLTLDSPYYHTWNIFRSECTVRLCSINLLERFLDTKICELVLADFILDNLNTVCRLSVFAHDTFTIYNKYIYSDSMNSNVSYWYLLSSIPITDIRMNTHWRRHTAT